MTLLFRRAFAILAAFGLAVSVCAYISSYFGTTMESFFRWAILLHVGTFISVLSILVVEGPAIENRRLVRKDLLQAMPGWVGPALKLLVLFLAIHFFVYFIQSDLVASPQIKNGQYVLSEHGRIVKLLSQHEYFVLKGAELRLFATGWMCFYFLATTYWWFSRNLEAPA